MMKRKDYQKPAMKVVKLQQRAHLLEASGETPRRAERADYESAEW